MARPIYSATAMLTPIKKESERLKVLFNASFNHVSDVLLLTEAMNTRYTKLVGLANALRHSAQQYNPIHRVALMELVELITYMEQHYSGFLNPELELADFEWFKLNHQVSAELIAIQDLLLSKGISKNLIYKINKAVDDLLNKDKHRAFCRADRQYLQAFMPALVALAADKRDKDWNLRLRRLLIQWNFNNMGVYKVLEHEQQQHISARRSYEKQHQYLFEQSFWLEQIQPITTSGYNRQALDLKSLLMKQLTCLRGYLTEVLQLKQYEVQRKLALNLNAEELAIEFKYNYDEGIFDYLHKKEAAEALSQHVKSIGTEEISCRTLTKFDKTKLHRAAVRVYHRYTVKLEKLAKDFDIKYTG